MRTEWISFLLTLLLVGLNLLFPQSIEALSPWLLGLGLLFPGIPHGAVDHYVRLEKVQWLSLTMARFTGQYVLIMLAMAGLWWLSPAVGLTSFIIYSAWHFGETDLRDWQLYSPALSWCWGLGVLLVILGSHFQSFQNYLQVYGLTLWPRAQIWLLGLGLAGLVIPIVQAPKHGFKPLALTALVVALGAFLPLLLSFALYFIAGHSLRGWRHLQAKTNGGFWVLLQRALPFSVLAFVFLGIAVGLGVWLKADGAQFWPLLFVFIAALSAPHVWVMHRFYQTKPKEL